METGVLTRSDRVVSWTEAFASDEGFNILKSRGKTDPDLPDPPVNARTPGNAQIRSKRFWEEGRGHHLVEFAEIAPGDRKSLHREHHAETVWFILDGEGEFYPDPETVIPIKAGMMAHAYPWEWHGMGNTGDRPLRYLSVEGPKLNRARASVEYTE